MRFDLIRSWRDLRRLQQILRRLDREVANTDTPNLARSNELLQNGPSISDRHVGYLEALRDRIDRRESLVGVSKSDRPVDLCQVGQSIALSSDCGELVIAYQVEIQVIGLEVCESLVEGFLDVVGVVVRVPQFASDLKKLAVSRKYTVGAFFFQRNGITHKDLFARHARLLPAVSDLILVLVTCSCVDMTVALAQGSLDGALDLMGFGELTQSE